MYRKLPFNCPVCGRVTEYDLGDLYEGANLTCPFCRGAVNLHGHMWEYLQKEIREIKEAGANED
jgi:hypothetical protein